MSPKNVLETRIRFFTDSQEHHGDGILANAFLDAVRSVGVCDRAIRESVISHHTPTSRGHVSDGGAFLLVLQRVLPEEVIERWAATIEWRSLVFARQPDRRK